MEDRVEVYMNSVAEIPCIYNTSKSASSPTIRWFVVSQIFRHVLLASLWNIIKSTDTLSTLMHSYLFFNLF